MLGNEPKVSGNESSSSGNLGNLVFKLRIISKPQLQT